MKRIICRIIELVFPNETAKIIARRTAKRTAMQRLLDASRHLRVSGLDTNETNRALRGALRAYELCDYEHVGERIGRAILANG